MNILVLNCGSSSVKFQVIQTDLDLIEKDADKRLAGGLLERVFERAQIGGAADETAEAPRARDVEAVAGVARAVQAMDVHRVRDALDAEFAEVFDVDSMRPPALKFL